MELSTHGSAVSFVRGRTEDQEALVIDANEAPFPEERFGKLHIDIADVNYVQQIFRDRGSTVGIVLNTFVDG